MRRFSLIVCLLCVGYLTAQAQIQTYLQVHRTAGGQILTTFNLNNIYASSKVYSVETSSKSLFAFAPQTRTYLGSPYLTFPIWQKGIIQFDQGGPTTAYELSYDLVLNRVGYRLPGQATGNYAQPYSFTVVGLEFTRHTNKLFGMNTPVYTTVVADGPAKLLKQVSNRLIAGYADYVYRQSLPYEILGTYKTTEYYYIQKGEAEPALITLSTKSVLNTLHEQANKLAPMLSRDPLTVQDVKAALTRYNTLMESLWPDKVSGYKNPSRKVSISVNPLFTDHLHKKLVYPSLARADNVYGRVYIGFDVDEFGEVKQVTLLSPDNAGFEFDQAALRVLKKLPKLNAAYVGHYALPIAFALTDGEYAKELHMPVNTLPVERLDGRTLLEEVVVPTSGANPVSPAREVWGYYK